MAYVKAFSLIELLVAMVLGVVVTLVLGELFINHERSFKFQQAVMQASHNGLLASNLLQTITENAGFTGCLSLHNLSIDNHLSNVATVPEKILSGTTLSKTWGHQPLASTSLLQLSYMSPNTVNLLETMHSSHYLSVSNDLKFKSGDIVMLSDCRHADLFKVDEVYSKGSAQIIFTHSKLAQYRKDAELGLWQAPILYVANTSRLDTFGKPIPALYWHTLSGRDEELIEGILGFNVKSIKTTQADKLAFTLLTMSIDTVSYVPTSRMKKVSAHHILQHWQFLDYVG